MKLQNIILGVVVLFLCSCSKTTEDSRFYDEGVSWELARHRKATIQDLKYNLRFKIPADKEQDIQGLDTICFQLKEAQEVVLDFREDPQKIKTVQINGKEVDCNIEKEHIILPEEHLQQGQNQIIIDFIAGNQSLNRNEDYMYTLFVPDRARTAFPCMEQPNLKALFTLTLEIPTEWEAVTNTYCQDINTLENRKVMHFAQTEPLSTYLFAFAAGKFSHYTYTEDGRTIGAYCRETDPKRIAQLPTIFQQVLYSLKWQEDFTGMPYPFAKYDFVVLPGFQFGGMEHTGATFYNDTRLFLNEHPTPDEELSRAQLIAHETSHMWFGDCVTMDWFDDVWTKEVFANYFAAAITAPLFPQINHDLNWMKTYTAAALSEDQTLGGTAIRQDLDNMKNAGLIYNQIIYNKAPVMMKKLVELMGEEAFRRGIQKYMNTYKYGNATWDDLIQILNAESEEDLETFSEAWVNQKGMPQIQIALNRGELEVTQDDPYNRGVIWPQSFQVRLKATHADTTVTVHLNSTENEWSIPLPKEYEYAQIFPNSDGRGYGFITMNRAQLDGLLKQWMEESNETSKYAYLALLHQNYLENRISNEKWIHNLRNTLVTEKNALTASTLIGYLQEPLLNLQKAERAELENELWKLSGTHPLYSARVQLIRLLYKYAISDTVVDHLYSLWENQSNELLGVTDYMSMSYELAIRKPEKSKEILSSQRQRIQDPDRLRQFDFISRAAVADTTALDSLFHSLVSHPEARRIEPWTRQVLSLLNHPLREKYSVKYIYPALEVLGEVQKTGDIFFPGNWCSSLLSNHRSKEAYNEVKNFIKDHPNYPQLRLNKILLGSYNLFRINNEKLF